MPKRPCRREELEGGSLIGQILAKGMIDMPIWTDREMIPRLGDEKTHFYYEQTMVNNKGNAREVESKLSIFDLNKNGKKFSDWADGMFYGNPSNIFDSRFYKPIEGLIQKWDRAGRSRESYNAMVKKPIQTLKKSLQDDLNGVPSQWNHRVLKQYHLTKENVYEAVEWLDFLEDGGFIPGDKSPPVKTIDNIGQAMAKWNPTWSLGNLVDLQRVASDYVARGEIVPMIKGTLKTLQQGPMGIFKEQESLRKYDLYRTVERVSEQKNDNIFSWSVTAQKNLVANIELAAGRDPMKGIGDKLFDYKPWDVPRSMRIFKDANANNVTLKLARYPINEARWTFQAWNSSFKILAGKGTKEDAYKMLSYGILTALKTATLGVEANVPAPIWFGLNEEQKESIRNFSEETPGLALLKKGSREAFKLLGVDAEIELAEYTQPFGGTVGAALGILTNTGKDVVESLGQATTDLVEGDLAPATLNAAAAAMTILHLRGTTKSWTKLDPINSTSLTRLIRKYAKTLEEDYAVDQQTREIFKAILGDKYVKKPEKEAL